MSSEDENGFSEPQFSTSYTSSSATSSSSEEYGMPVVPGRCMNEPPSTLKDGKDKEHASGKPPLLLGDLCRRKLFDENYRVSDWVRLELLTDSIFEWLYYLLTKNIEYESTMTSKFIRTADVPVMFKLLERVINCNDFRSGRREILKRLPYMTDFLAKRLIDVCREASVGLSTIRE